MNLYDWLLLEYGYNEPILFSELQEIVNMDSDTLQEMLDKLIRTGKINKLDGEEDITFIPKQNSVFKTLCLTSIKFWIENIYAIEMG